MNIGTGILKRIRRAVERRVNSRPPDFIIGGRDNPYLLRWYLIPRNPVFNIYAHRILRDDDDRALHDHPWVNVSLILDGGYMEITHCRETNGPAWAFYMPGALKFRRPKYAHRIKLAREAMTGPIPALTLFITGPRVREWGFLCEHGWRHWKEFTAPGDSGVIGKGCD